MAISAGIEFVLPVPDDSNRVISLEAVDFIVSLQRQFNARRKELLAVRELRQQKLDTGERSDFLAVSSALAIFQSES